MWFSCKIKDSFENKKKSCENCKTFRYCLKLNVKRSTLIMIRSCEYLKIWKKIVWINAIMIEDNVVWLSQIFSFCSILIRACLHSPYHLTETFQVIVVASMMLAGALTVIHWFPLCWFESGSNEGATQFNSGKLFFMSLNHNPAEKKTTKYLLCEQGKCSKSRYGNHTVWFVWFVWFYGISTFVGYLTPNPFLSK